MSTLCSGELISCGPHGFREEDFLSFSNYKSMGANDPKEHGQFGPQGHGWQDLCRRHCYIKITLFLYMYIAQQQGQITLGDKILFVTKTVCYFGHTL